MYPTRAIIDLAAIRYNYRHAKSQNPLSETVTVIKADAYGHGAVQVAKTLLSEGVRHLAIFRIEEAAMLRNNGIDAPIWCLLGALDSEIPDAIELKDVTLACWSLDNARKLNDAARKAGKTIPVHVKIDTGMGRLGVLPHELPAFLAELQKLEHIAVTGAFSHMAIAEEPNHPVTIRQIQAFQDCCNVLPPSCAERHLSATRAMYNHYLPNLPYERLGIALYGPEADIPQTAGLHLAMTFASKVISLKKLPAGTSISYCCRCELKRDSLVAIAPVGYASALPRCLTGKCDALIRGRRVPSLGTICMDMTMFDVTDVPGVSIDDDVVLFGTQGDETISAIEVAQKANTIPYELFCHVGMTQPRFYINN